MTTEILKYKTIINQLEQVKPVWEELCEQNTQVCRMFVNEHLYLARNYKFKNKLTNHTEKSYYYTSIELLNDTIDAFYTGHVGCQQHHITTFRLFRSIILGKFHDFLFEKQFSKESHGNFTEFIRVPLDVLPDYFLAATNIGAWLFSYIRNGKNNVIGAISITTCKKDYQFSPIDKFYLRNMRRLIERNLNADAVKEYQIAEALDIRLQPYHVRQFLKDYFTSDDFDAFIFDYYTRVHEMRTAGMSRDQVITLLFDYLKSEHIINEFLDLLRELRPEQFEIMMQKV